MPVEYIDTKDNMQYVDKIINLFPNQICIEPKEVSQDEINCMFVIPTPKRTHYTDLAPIVLLKAKAVYDQLCGRQFICLLNSCSTRCVFNKRSLPFGTQTTKTPYNIVQTTTQGTHSSNQVVFVNDIQLPKFVNQRHINGELAYVFDSPNCPYDIILDQDFLHAIGIKMDFELNNISWMNMQVDIKNIKQFDQSKTWENFMQEFEMEQHVGFDIKDEYLCNDKMNNYASDILDSKYGKVSVNDVVAMQKHLTPE